MQMKKSGSTNRNQKLIDYYNQYAQPMSPPKEEGAENYDGILNDMERN